MRIAVFDVGSNSTRVYVADVSPLGAVTDVYRRSQVTRLAEGVQRTGRLNQAAIARVLAALDRFTAAAADHRAERTVAVLTSAVRDAANGPELVALIRERYGVEAHTIAGELEAKLTFQGALSEHADALVSPTLVIDIGGGSTELIVGRGRQIHFATSLQAGVVRQSERHLHSDPPTAAQLSALRREMRDLVGRAVPLAIRKEPARAIAVAGTATSAAAIDQALDRYDTARVHGYRLELSTLNLLLARLASLPLAQRRSTRGLQPDRASVVVAGLALLIETLTAFGLSECEASEHDILRGVALAAANPQSEHQLDG